eukprot:CAMPEP_0117423412 /NCGR_PEP_ID=MMETSP0758-20121206/4038_1 /TAXON_ID=63605 /ORGANISM="Percolomonas cosmopolitus, Strain AE-1 (ATCC 50343)" /LENGTH=389 /DNA_ID=CAMNT_0005206579 /DNA_START=78 /DNA_END=1247 /DNA_ORIENTATION=+
MPSALEFETIATSGKARCSTLKLPHYTCDLPMFMPVGTQGTIKGLTSQQVEELDCHLILGNTYHLAQRPGIGVLEQCGGLHKFMNWNRAMLTDSGGFQMVSLLKLANITEEGVSFQSPHDGSMMMLTPEYSMHIQNVIGADIMMALDDVVSSLTTGPRVREAMERTLRWIDRCIAAHKRPTEQNLFGIVQGGLDLNLRKICVEELVKRNLPGYAIGGLSGGEDKNQFWKVVNFCTGKLPQNKPRYCMGVGYPVDLVVCVALGVDMFDCVYPSRTARFGTALVDGPNGVMKLRSKSYACDFRSVDSHVDSVLRHHTRSYLNKMAGRDSMTGSMMTTHNIAYQMKLMKDIRTAIKQGYFEKFVKNFMEQQYPRHDYPKWAFDALAAVGINL